LGIYDVRATKGGNIRNKRVTHPQARRRKDRAAERLIPDMDPAAQLVRLDLRLGKDIGAVKERARLKAKIAAAEAAKNAPKTEPALEKGDTTVLIASTKKPKKERPAPLKASQR
jgi:hypothetical protein